MSLCGKILKPTLNSDGYPVVSLYSLGKQSNKMIHALVAAVFIGDRLCTHEVNHKDGDKQNNCIGNLEYCTHAENMRHATDTGLCKSLSGESHSRAKLKDIDIPVIRNRIFLGHPLRAIAKDFGVVNSTILAIKQGKRWAHIE